MNAVKATVLILTLPIATAMVMAPQDAAKTQKPQDPTAVMTLSEMQYTDLQGKTVVVSARNVVEIRLLGDNDERVRLELLYDNGDYSLIDAQALHLLRNGPSTREVKLVRAKGTDLRFPQLP